MCAGKGAADPITAYPNAAAKETAVEKTWTAAKAAVKTAPRKEDEKTKHEEAVLKKAAPKGPAAQNTTSREAIAKAAATKAASEDGASEQAIEHVAASGKADVGEAADQTEQTSAENNRGQQRRRNFSRSPTKETSIGERATKEAARKEPKGLPKSVFEEVMLLVKQR